MKLEAVNGNLMSLTVKVPIDECKAEENVNGSAAESVDEGLEEADLIDEGGTVEMKAVGGKKKGARKKRSLNWEEAERGLLLEVIKPKVDFVENRNVDAKSIKAKRMAWMQITKQFNGLYFRHRSMEQIQVQWRSMKNATKREYQKHCKDGSLEGMEMIEFMEELQKNPVSARSQTRGGGGGSGAGAASHQHNQIYSDSSIKKEMADVDDDDTPLAALPTSTNHSEDTLQSSTVALPSPPPSAESQNDTQHAPPPTRIKKKPGPKPNPAGTSKPKRQRVQIATTPIEVIATHAATTVNESSTSSSTINQSVVALATQPTIATTSTTAVSTPIISSILGSGNNIIPPSSPGNIAAGIVDDKYKKQIFELMKRARLADMDYARREHEQKIRFDQIEQELKMRQLRDEHEQRIRHYQIEHEARMRAYTVNGRT